MNNPAEQLNSLTGIAAVALIAMVMGLLFIRLRQPPIVGYILAGVILGPTGFGFVHHSETIRLMAELGVLLLLFLIGMEISIRAFVMVIKPAVIITVCQITAAISLTALFGFVLGWSTEQILLLGFVMAISSTAVAIKILDDIDELRSITGRITVGVMIAQDIAIVPMLILAAAFGQGSGLDITVAFRIILAITILGSLLWYLSRPGKLRLPGTDVLNGRPDIIALAALAFCFSASTLSGLLGLSPVYGAFIAGLIIANSTLRSEVIEVTGPIQSVLIFVFFLSIGLLIDLKYIADHWLLVFSFAFGVIIVKTLLNITLIGLTGQPWKIAFPAGLAMAQIGEFSFILAAIGLRNGVINYDTYRLALSVIALSLIISPLWMTAARRVHDKTSAELENFRSALRETYSRDADHQRFTLRTPKVYLRAARLAWVRRQNKRHH